MVGTRASGHLGRISAQPCLRRGVERSGGCADVGQWWKVQLCTASHANAHRGQGFQDVCSTCWRGTGEGPRGFARDPQVGR